MKTKFIAVIGSMAILHAGASAAYDTFIRFHTPQGYIPTESQDATLSKVGFMQISSFSFGAENAVNIGSSSSGAGAGKVKFDDFTITKTVDSASPNLFGPLSAGQHFDYVDLVMRKSGGTSATSPVYLVYRFKTVFVSKINWSGSNGDEAPKETVTLAFGGMILQYQKQNANGSMAAAQISGWSQITNTADNTAIDITH